MRLNYLAIAILLVTCKVALSEELSSTAASIEVPAPETAASGVWKNQSELGLVSITGNAQSSTYHAKEQLSYERSSFLYSLKASYLRGKADEVENSRNWMVAPKFEWTATPVLSLFVAETIEGNKYAGFDTRYNSDAGLKYYVLKTDRTTLSAEAGYRFIVEDKTGGAENLDAHAARTYAEWVQQWSAQVSTQYFIEYIPNFTRSNDWQVKSEVALLVKMSNILSLKSSYNLDYDHDPRPAPGKTNTTFTTSLVATF